ncbi:MAG: aminopeptidase P N-terminal domain-containing protein [Candidatus Saccharimonadales bacterium]
MDSSFFADNRLKLTEKLNNGLVVLTAYAALQRSNDTAHYFEQEANFWYLTGIEEPGWQVIVDGKKSWLVAPDVDEVHRIFDGALSNDEAKSISGVETVLSRADGDTLLRDLSKKHSLAYTLGKDPYKDHYNFSLNPAPGELRSRLERIFTNVHDCLRDLAKLRAIKQPREIKEMKKAIKLTEDAFKFVYENLVTYKTEYEVEAAFTYYFGSRGVGGHAYEPIVASGSNACTLHYIKNNQRLKPKSFLLIDIGARHGGYAADVTRTYAIGRVSARAKAIHTAVETAQRDIIKLIHPGVSLQAYMENVDSIMKDVLKSRDLLKTDEDYRKYFPHSVSHGLGIDVHDSLGGFTTFQPGMVLTVEPGIYIPEERIGVRIEDDILVAEDGAHNLSRGLSTAL